MSTGRGDNGRGRPALEQRRESRAPAVYLPCCMRNGEGFGFGLIRNLSASGLMVESRIAAEAGAEIAYCLDSTQWRRARIAWRDGNRIGLQNLDRGMAVPAHPPRAIRFPSALFGRIWVEGRVVEIGIGNLSQRGVLAFGVPPLAPAQLVTLTVAGHVFRDTSLRWWSDGSAGLRFDKPMALRALCELVESASRGSSGLSWERRIARLLEVVPANDERM